MKSTIKSLKRLLKKKTKPVTAPVIFESILLKKSTYHTRHICVFNRELSLIAVVSKNEEPRQFSKFSLSEATEITNLINNFDKVYYSL